VELYIFDFTVFFQVYNKRKSTKLNDTKATEIIYHLQNRTMGVAADNEVRSALAEIGPRPFLIFATMCTRE